MIFTQTSIILLQYQNHLCKFSSCWGSCSVESSNRISRSTICLWLQNIHNLWVQHAIDTWLRRPKLALWQAQTLLFGIFQFQTDSTYGSMIFPTRLCMFIPSGLGLDQIIVFLQDGQLLPWQWWLLAAAVKIGNLINKVIWQDLFLGFWCSSPFTPLPHPAKHTKIISSQSILFVLQHPPWLMDIDCHYTVVPCHLPFSFLSPLDHCINCILQILQQKGERSACFLQRTKNNYN